MFDFIAPPRAVPSVGGQAQRTAPGFSRSPPRSAPSTFVKKQNYNSEEKTVLKRDDMASDLRKTS